MAPGKRVRMQTFGNFEVYVDGKPLEFKYSRTKEMLAYLVDRQGALCTMAEIQAVLFEDEMGHESYIKSLRRDLQVTLDEAGCGNARRSLFVYRKGRNPLWIPSKSLSISVGQRSVFQ